MMSLKWAPLYQLHHYNEHMNASYNDDTIIYFIFKWGNYSNFDPKTSVLLMQCVICMMVT